MLIYCETLKMNQEMWRFISEEEVIVSVIDLLLSVALDEFYAEEVNVCVKNKLMFHIVTIITFCVEVITEYEGKEFIWPNVLLLFVKIKILKNIEVNFGQMSFVT